MSFPASPGRRAWAALGVATGLALFLSLSVSPAFSQNNNDDPPPILSVAHASAEEGADLVFTATLSPASDQTVTVSYYTVDGPAVSGEDYEAIYPDLLLTIEPGDTTGAITVRGLEDDVDEPDETFEVWLDGPVGAAFADGSDTLTITGTITDDDVPALAISGPDPVDEDTPDATLNFIVTLSIASHQEFTVDYAIGGTAQPGADYTAAGGSLTFVQGDTTETIQVPVTEDTLYEDDETVTVTLSNVSVEGIDITGAQADGTISNDDPLPTLLVADASAEEGEDLVFTATLSPASYQTVTGSYVTADASATSGEDYVAEDEGVLTIGPGDTTGSITVRGMEDGVDEPDETFEVWLSDLAGAAFADGSDTVIGTITDDDGPPIVSINNAKIYEGSSGTVTLRFGVSLRPQSGKEVTVDYDTSAGEGGQPATVGDDFIATEGTLHFRPGDTRAYVDVAVIADGVAEADETLSVTLHNPYNASFAHGASTITGTGTITDKRTTPPRPPRRPNPTPRPYVAEVPPPQAIPAEVASGMVGVEHDPATGEHTLVAVAAGDTQVEIQVGGESKTIKVSLKSDETVGTQITFPGSTGTLANVERIEIEAVSEDAGWDQDTVAQHGGSDRNPLLYGFRILDAKTIINITLYDDEGNRINQVDIPLKVCLPANAAISLADRPHLVVFHYDPSDGWHPLPNPQVSTTPTGEILVCGDATRFTLFAVGYVLAIEVAPEAVRVPEGETASYAVALTGPPAEAVTVTPASSNPDVATVGEPLVFRPNNWDTPQRITVTGVADDDAVVESVTVTHVVAGGDYDGVTAADVAVNITESQHAGLTVTPEAVSLLEGSSVGYSVALTSEPTDGVIVKVEPQGAGVILTPATLTFTPQDWRAPQKVLLTAMPDSDSNDETVRLTLTASGADYEGVVSTVIAEVSDVPLPVPAVTPVPTPTPAPTASPTQDPAPRFIPTRTPSSTPGPTLTPEAEPTPSPTATPAAARQPATEAWPAPAVAQPATQTPEAPEPPVPTVTEPVSSRDGGDSPAWVVALFAAVLAAVGVLGIRLVVGRQSGDGPT